MIDLTIEEKYFKANFLNKTLDFHFYTPLYWHIIGIRISGNSVGYIQTTITLLTFVKEIQNLCSNSSSECLLSKTLSLLLRIPYRSKVNVEMVTEVDISTHFQSD